MNQKARDIHDQVTHLVEPILAQEGLVLFDVKVAVSGRRTSIECLIDRPEGGLDLNALGGINRRLRDRLEEAGVAAEGFSLWVSTPGVDRPLREEKDFRRVKNRLVEIWVRRRGSQTVEGPITGLVKEVGAGELLLMRVDQPGHDGGLLRIMLDEIMKARQKI